MSVKKMMSKEGIARIKKFGSEKEASTSGKLKIIFFPPTSIYFAIRTTL